MPEGIVGLYSPKLGVGATTKLTPEGKFKFDTPLEIGDYVATVSIPESDSPKIIIDPKKFPHIPRKYHNPNTSGLPATVAKGANKFDFKLKY